MKRFLLLLTLLCTLFSAVQATEVTIGEDSLTTATGNSYLPANSLYNYSYTQQIYTSEEIGMAGTINSITFWLYGNANLYAMPITIYMAEVDKASFSSTTNWETVTASDIVYTGTITVHNTTAEEYTFDLETPFVYNGTSNLLVAINNTTGQWKSGLNGLVFTPESGASEAIYVRQDGSAYDPTAPTFTATGVSTAKNIIRLDITPAGGTVVVCNKPDAVEVSDVTANSATVAISGGSSASYNVDYKAATDADWTSIKTTSTTVQLTGLQSNTAYSVRVQCDCGDGATSGYRNASFNTLIGLPYLEQFGTSTIPSGWSRYEGLLNDDGSAALTTSSSYWVFGSFNDVFDSHAKIEVYSTRKAWLVTPEIPMENNQQLTFNLALTHWTGSGVPAPQNPQPDARFIVLATMDGGANWTTLREWNNTGSQYVFDNIVCSAEGEEVAIDLSAYGEGQTIQLGFYVYHNTGGDNNLHIDDVQIAAIPTCRTPENLSEVAGRTTKNSVQLNWDIMSADPESAWLIQYKLPSAEEWVSIPGGQTSDKPYTLENLAEFTEYNVRIAAKCDDSDPTVGVGCSKWSKPITVKTASGVPFVQSFDTVNLPSEWKRYEALINDVLMGEASLSATSDGWDVGAANGIFPNTDNHLVLNLSGENTKHWIVGPTIAMEPDQQLSFDVAFTKAAGNKQKVDAGAQGSQAFIVFVTFNGGQSWNILGHWNNNGSSSVLDNIKTEGQTVKFNLGAYYASSIQIAFYGESTNAEDASTNIHIANVKIDDIPACAKPTSLEITGIQGTTATAVWEADEEGTWQYGYVVKPAGEFEPTDEDYIGTTTATQFAMEDLAQTTHYLFFVRRVCGENDYSEAMIKEFATIQTPASLPYDHNFESGNGWLFIGSDEIDNHWVWAENADANNTASGSKALYISNDNLGTYAYSQGSGKAATVYATKTFFFDQTGMYSFQYDWKCLGYSTSDYLRVALIPADLELAASTSVPTGFSTTKLPDGWAALDGGSKLNLSNAWNHQLVEHAINEVGYYKMVLVWRNSTYTGSGYGNPPAAVDNIKISRIQCPKPTNLAYEDLTASSIKLSWDAVDGVTFDYALVEASEDGSYVEPTEFTAVPDAANTIDLEDLAECTFYKFYLRKNCGEADGVSDVISIEFQTKQNPVVVGKAFTDDFESGNGWLFANGAMNAWVIDTATNNGGLKSLYVSQDGGVSNTYYKSTGGLVFAHKLFTLDDAEYIFQFDWKAGGEGTSTIWDYLRVALVPEDVELNAISGTTLPSGYSATGLPTGWIALDGGYLNLNDGWETITSSELPVTAGNYKIVFGWRWDTSGGDDPAAAIDNFSIRKVLCTMPANLAVDSVSTDSAFLKWEPQGAESTWLVRYKKSADEAWGEPIEVNADSMWLENLDPASIYEVQVAAWCDPSDDETISEYIAAVSFATECVPVDTIQEDFENTLLCGRLIQDENGYPVVLSNYPEDAYSGTKFLYFASSINNDVLSNEYAILPELTTLEGKRVKFYARKDVDSNEDVTLIVGVMTDDADTTTFAALDTIVLTSADYTQFVVSFAAYEGEGKFVALKMLAATQDVASALIEDVIVEYVPACVDPTELRADKITPNAAVIHWTPQGEEANWLVRYKKSSAESWADTIEVNVDTLLLSNLASATSYDVQIAAWCDPADAEAVSPFSGSMSFKTMYDMPFEQNFDASSIPADWSLYTGLMTDSLLNGLESLSSATSGWNFGSNNGVFDSHARTNIYGASWNKWLTTPQVFVEGNPQLTFDLALTAYSGTGAASGTCDDDKFVVLVSADNGNTWSILREWNNSGSEYVYNDIATSGEFVAIELTDYIGQNIIVAFYGESTVSGNGDNNLHIDNVLISFIPSCPKPNGLSAVLTKANGSVATLNWNAGGEETQWVVEYSKNAEFAEALAVTANETTVALSGLESDSTYYARVKAVCGENDESQWSKAISFVPTDAIIVNDSTATNSYVPFYGYYINYEAKSQFVVPASELESIVWDTITQLTFYTSTTSAALTGSEFEVYMAPFDTTVISSEQNWNDLEKVMSKAHLSVVDKQMVVTLSEPYQYTGGNLLIGFKLATPASSTGSYVYFYGKSNQTGASISGYKSSATGTLTMTQRNFLPKMKIDLVHGVEPSCIKVKDIAVSNITSSSAVLSWSKGTEDQSAWQIAIDSVADFDPNTAELIAADANTYALADLAVETTYYVYVRANCSDAENEDYSVWSKVFSFTTASACQTPSDIQASEITTTSASISWNTYGQEGFNLLYSDGTAIDTIYNVNSPYLLEGLAQNTSYGVKVQAACAAQDSIWSSIFTFKTAYGIPFSEKFNATSIPADWSMHTGLLANVMSGEAQLASATYGWTFGTSNNVFDSHARTNIYGTSSNKWLATPAIQIEGDVQLTFDLALTVYTSGSSAAPTAGAQEDDKFVVLISTDNGANWSVLRQWDNAGSEYVYDEITNDANGQQETISLSAYNGQSIKIAFYGESTVSGGDNNLHIDNVLIDLVPDCVKPTGLNISEIKAHSAKIAWTAAEGQNAWQIAYDTIASNRPDTIANVLDVTENPYVISNLDPSKRYYVYVRANCGELDGDSKWTDAKSFTTTVACPAPKNLDVELTSGNGTIATLKWTAGQDEQAWIVEYSTNADMSDSVAVVANDTTLALEGLTAETKYYARVKADCGELDGVSLYSAIISFTPTNAYLHTIFDGSATNQYVPVYGYYADDATQRSQFIIPEEALEGIEWDSIRSLTFYGYYADNSRTTWGAAQFEAYVAEAAEATLAEEADWASLTKVMNAVSLSIVENKMVVTFDEAFQYQGGNLLVGLKQTMKGTYARAYWYGVTATGASMGGYGTSLTQQNFLPKMTIEYVPGIAPACPNPKNLAVSNITAEGATFTWKAVEGATWMTTVAEEGQEPAGFISSESNMMLIQGLSESTNYVFYLYKDCGEDGTSDTFSIAFTTLEYVEAIPYVENFDAINGWKFANQTNGWVIGNAADEESNALYISNDGSAYAYDDEAASVSYASKLFDFDIADTTYVFDYAYKVVGEAADGETFDYLRIGLVPASSAIEAGSASLPDGWIALDGNEELHGTENWIYVHIELQDIFGQYKIVCLWVNDESGSDGTPAAIKDFSIAVKQPQPCNAPTSLQVTEITHNSALVSWIGGDAWQIAYSADPEFDIESATLIDAAQSEYALVDLESNTSYHVYVRTVCGETYSEWSDIIFSTSQSTAFDAIDANNQAVKFIKNDHVYILINGVLYNVTGQRVE